APYPIVAAPAHAIGQAHILVFGGDDGTHYADTETLGDEHPGFRNEILAYHTITDSWTQYGIVPDPVVTTTAVEWQGRIVIPGGEDRPGHRAAVVASAAAAPFVGRFGTVNWVVLGSYFVILILMGAYFSRRQKSTHDYFLGGGRVPWWAMGLSIFGTQLSAITFLSIPARAYSSDWVYVWANAAIVLITPYVVFVVIPAYRRGNYTTAYEYLERRFNYAVRVYGAFIFLLFQAGRMGIVLFLPALALHAVTGLPVTWCILAMGVLATLYTVLGGIEAVIWTDVLQVVILLAGVVVALVVILLRIDTTPADAFAIAVDANKFHMIDWTWDATTTAIWVAIIGNVFGVAYPYTADQTLVQRYLASASEKEAKRATWTNALMSIPATLLFFGVGTALFVYFKTHPQQLDPALPNDAVFPLFIVQQLPVGFSGLVVAAIFAAAMSSLDSSMNSLATVAIHDFYRRFKKDLSDLKALRAARLMTVVFGVLGTSAALVMAGLDAPSLFDQYLRILNFTGGGLAGVLALGILTRRANAAGAIAGAIVSAATVIYVATYTPLHHFLYALVGFATAFVVGYIASLVLPARGRTGAGAVTRPQ
ncbi:MAG: sodium:solute symporter, partial [Candidatus Hydrogenedentales bacterium]